MNINCFDFHTSENWNTPKVKQINIVLLLFDISDLYSFQKLKTSWITRIKEKMNFATIILVGTKSDLRNEDNNQQLRKFNDKKKYSKNGIRESVWKEC